MTAYAYTYAAAGFICAVAAYLGALTFGAAAVAPLAVRLLPAASSATLLRAFWVRFHRFGVGVGTVLTVVSAIGAFATPLPMALHALLCTAAGAMTACLVVGLRLIPAINDARDRGDGSRFARLHRIDVLLVAAAMVLGTALLGGSLYALPAFFVHA